MTQKIIDTTTPQPNGKIGDTAKVAFGKINDNFTELFNSLNGKAAATHTHGIAQVTGLQAALDGKAAATHTHGIADVSGLQAALDGKANSGHTHSASDITSGTLSDARLPRTMSGKKFTGEIVAPAVAIGDQLGYIYQPNSAGAIAFRIGTAGNEKWFALSENGRFIAHSGGGSFNGTVEGHGFVNTSSRELKQDIRPLHVDADIIDRLQPVTFRYKATPEREVAGLILEDVAEIFPLACVGGGVDYGQLVTMLIATIQHDRAQLRDLAARVAALEQTLGQAQPTGGSESVFGPAD